MAHKPSPFFPVPVYRGPFNGPLLRFCAMPFGTRAGLALNGGLVNKTAQPTQSGRLSYMSSTLERSMKKGAILKAGDWWLVLSTDRTGVFVNSHPKKGAVWLDMAPVVVTFVREATLNGRSARLGFLDLHDAMENPDLPDGFGEKVRDGLAEELESWGEAYAQSTKVDLSLHPLAANARPFDPAFERLHDAPFGEPNAWQPRVPAWWAPRNDTTDEDRARLNRICTGLSYMEAANQPIPNGVLPIYAVLGGRVDGYGRFHGPRVVCTNMANGTEKLADRATKALEKGAAWWPHARRVAPGLTQGTNGKNWPMALCGGGSSVPQAASAHERLALMNEAVALLAEG